MKLELSKVSHGLKIVGIVLVIIYLGVGSYVIDGGQNPVMERVSPLWKCTVASVVFDLAFLAFYALMIGASYKDNDGETLGVGLPGVVLVEVGP